MDRSYAADAIACWCSATWASGIAAVFHTDVCVSRPSRRHPSLAGLGLLSFEVGDIENVYSLWNFVYVSPIPIDKLQNYMTA